MKTDRLRRFTLEHQGIRGSLVRIPETWRCIQERGVYAPAVGRILGHAVVAAALIGKNLKFDGRLTLQLQGSGPLHLLVVQCTHDLGIRGLAKCRETQLVEFGGLVQPVIHVQPERRRNLDRIPVIRAEAFGQAALLNRNNALVTLLFGACLYRDGHAPRLHEPTKFHQLGIAALGQTADTEIMGALHHQQVQRPAALQLQCQTSVELEIFSN